MPKVGYASRSEQSCENINWEQIETISSLLDSNMPDHVRVNEATERLATLFTIASNPISSVQIKGNFVGKGHGMAHCVGQRVPNIMWRKSVLTHISHPVIDSYLQKQAETTKKKKQKKKQQQQQQQKTTMNKYIAKHRKYNENKLRNQQ